MLVLIILAVALSVTDAAPSTAPLEAVLRSPEALRGLYNRFKEQENVQYSLAEDKLRLRVFRAYTAKVVDCENGVPSARFAVNKFALMTEAERRAYGGFNASTILSPPPPIPDDDDDNGPPPIPDDDDNGPPPIPDDDDNGPPPIPDDDDNGPPPIPDDDDNGPPPIPDSESGPPPSPTDSKFWTDLGAVTEVQDQGSCGSCWTFAAVAVLETWYKKTTGVLRKFSEQELLDCSPDSGGCSGGHPDEALVHVTLDGRLAPQKLYPYKESMGECKADRKKNSLIGARVVESIGLPIALVQPYITALSQGAIWIGTRATECLYSYTGGIMQDSTCGDLDADHIMAAVGYTPTYILVKNSWGKDWGEQGFVRFAREKDNCSVYIHGGYPVVVASGKKDTTKSDEAAVYEKPDEDCLDEMTNCSLDNCDDILGSRICKKTCGKC